MSMIRTLNENFVNSPHTFVRRSIHVIHGVSCSNHLGYRQELERLAAETRRDPARRLALTYLPTISRSQEDPSWTGLTGRAETLFNSAPGADSPAQDLQAIVRGLFQSILRPETHAVYVCGYPGTVDNMMRLLSSRGFKPDVDLKREKYYP
jgi:NAD(P)H-flavin reductase